MSDTWRNICFPLKLECGKDTYLVEYLKMISSLFLIAIFSHQRKNFHTDHDSHCKKKKTNHGFVTHVRGSELS